MAISSGWTIADTMIALHQNESMRIAMGIVSEELYELVREAIGATGACIIARPMEYMGAKGKAITLETNVGVVWSDDRPEIYVARSMCAKMCRVTFFVRML